MPANTGTRPPAKAVKATPAKVVAPPAAPRRKAETVSTTAATRSKQPAPRPAARRTPTAAPRRSNGSRRSSGPRMSLAVPQALQREILAVLVVLFAILTAISLNTPGGSGVFGAWGALLTQIFGWAAWMVPVAIGAVGAMLFVAGMLKIDRLRWEMPLGIGLILAAVVGLLHMSIPKDLKLEAGQTGQAGGMVGYWVSTLFESLAGALGGSVILIALAIIGTIMAFHLSLGDLLRLLGRGGNTMLSLIGTREADAPPGGIAPPVATPMSKAGRTRAAEDDGLPADFPRINLKDRAVAHAPTTPLAAVAFEEPPRILGAGVPPAPPAEAEKPVKKKSDILEINGAQKKAMEQLALPTPGRTGMIWKLPELTLLERSSDVEINDTDLMQKARRIEEALATFGVEARVREINSGPAVTQFALEPGEGVRVAKISGLANDLALALAAPSIRIEAPIPGMARVGVEVPNITPALVGLRNIMETDMFKHARAGKLRIPVGRDSNNQPVITDLAKLPHLLIAGATGSGKSVAINALIISFLMQYTPDELRMLMIDPKRVELSGFNGIPHLLRPVVTEMKSEKDPSSKGPRPLTAIEVLKWLLWEMERRYKIFARGSKDAEGVSRIFRNIDQYHTAARSNPAMEQMPYIVLIIDELADLMLVAPEDVETALCRLAQLARATGIHLIIATQRPSVDVVTGLIKANFPARIAFAVTSMIDSRVILDSPGAEKLLGRGDALYTASDESKPIRVQGTFVSDKETERVINCWRQQLPDAPPVTDVQPRTDSPHLLAGANGTPGGLALSGQQVQIGSNVPMPDWLAQAESGTGDGQDEDALLKQAVDLVKKHRYASTSMLQRRLRIGYNRAARLVEQMEEMGIVGPAEGSRSREVLVEADAADGADTEPAETSV